MDNVLVIVGLVVGLFLWSSIYGSIFGTLPLQRQLKKHGAIQSINWLSIIAPIVVAVLVITLTAIFVRHFFYGTLFAGVIMLFNIGKLRGEALENYQRDLNRTRTGKVE